MGDTDDDEWEEVGDNDDEWEEVGDNDDDDDDDDEWEEVGDNDDDDDEWEEVGDNDDDMWPIDLGLILCLLFCWFTKSLFSVI